MTLKGILIHARVSSRATAALAILSFVAAPLIAANHLVTMTENWEFVPPNLQINAGDTVTWFNADDLFDHDATGSWGSVFVPSDEMSAPLVFTTPGTYPYRDLLFSNPTGTSGMIGSIEVLAVATLPPALLIEPLLLADGSFRFTLTNLTVGRSTVVEYSTNLTSWDPVSTNVPDNNVLAVTNPPVAGAQAVFYRSYQPP